MVKWWQVVTQLSLCVVVLLGECGVAWPTSARAAARAPMTGGTITMVMAHVFPVESLEHRAAVKFAQELSKETNGRVEVRIFPASQLGGFAEIAQQQKSGATHIQFISTTALGGVAAIATVDSWPFMFDSKDQFDKAYASQVGRDFIAAIEVQSGYRILAPTYKGFRQIYVNKPMRSTADLTGLKIRVPGLNMVVDAFKAWGMAPTPMAVSEIFTAMQQNVVNAVEIELPTALSMGLAEVTRTVAVTNHMMPNYAWVFWGKYLDGLPDDVKAAVQKVAQETSAWFAAELVKAEQAALDRFKAAGAQVITVDTGFMRKAVQDILAPKYPDLAQWAHRLREAGRR